MNSLEKLFCIIDIFLDIGDVEVRLSELAQLSGLHLATVNRIASTAVEHGYMTQSSKGGRYSLGPKFFQLSTVFENKHHIRNVAMPYLTKIQKSVYETVALYNWNGKNFIFVDEVRSRHPLNLSQNFGSRLQIPLHSSSVGKIVLADMSEREKKAYLNETPLESFTQNTIKDPKIIMDQLVQVSRDGIAYEMEETILGGNSIAAGIRDTEGMIVACIAVLGPAVRLTSERMSELAPMIKDCALKISEKLGYKQK